MSGDLRKPVRLILSLGTAAGSVVIAAQAVTGRLGLIWVISMTVTGLAVAYALPRGGRAAATLFAVWCGVGVATLGRQLAEAEAELIDRIGHALIWSIGFAASAGVAFWACGSHRGSGERQERTQNGSS